MQKSAFFFAVASLFLGRAARAQQLATGDPANSFDLFTFAKGLSAPTDIVILPDGRAVITLQQGDVAVYTGATKTIAGHIPVMPTNGEQGLLGVVADPNFATNQYLYFYADVGATAGEKHQILRVVLGSNNLLGAQTVILGTGGPTPGILGPANHNGGSMVIYQNQLYIGVGDTGANATPPVNKFSSCLNQANGKILRINLDGSIPTTNPLYNTAAVTACASTNGAFTSAAPDKRIFAWGLRNPFRFWIDPSGTQAGTMWIGDVGETTREEISVGKGDQHYGYPFQEGTTDWGAALLANECMGVSPARACTPAVYDYPHTNGNNCVIGGLIPSGCGWIDPWKSRYFFADWGSGNVWTLDVNAARTGVSPGGAKDFAKLSGPSSFRMGPNDALYIVETTGGSVERITPKGQAAACAVPPDAGTPRPDGGAGGSAIGSDGGLVGTGGQGGVFNGGDSGNNGAGGSSMGTGEGGGGDVVGPGGIDASLGSGGATQTTGGAVDDGLTIERQEGACLCSSPGRRTGGAGAAAAFGLALFAAHGARRKRVQSKTRDHA